jgi:hypothetical protein
MCDWSASELEALSWVRQGLARGRVLPNIGRRFEILAEKLSRKNNA